MTDESVALTEEEIQRVSELQQNIQDLNRQLREIEIKRKELGREFTKYLDEIAREKLKDYADWRNTYNGPAPIFVPMISADNRYLSIADIRRR